MKLKNKYKWILGLGGLIGIITIPTIATLTSCSSDDSSTIQTYDVKFNSSSESTPSSFSTYTTDSISDGVVVDRPTVLPFWPSNSSSENEIDPNFNRNAIFEFLQLIDSTIDKISYFAKKTVQNDLNDVVLDFLSVVENENHNTEIELSDRTDINGNVITVNNITID